MTNNFLSEIYLGKRQDKYVFGSSALPTHEKW